MLRVHEATVMETVHSTQPGRPGKDRARRIRDHRQGSLAAPLVHYPEQLKHAAWFILATHELDGEVLSDEVMLTTYQAQSISERGVKFLKDPRFLAAPLFLKKVERLRALLMVMTVGLLVYAALEHRIRTPLAAPQARMPAQQGNPTPKPTARWVFELFWDGHLLLISQATTQVLTMNLQEELRTLLALLGSAYQQAYP